MRKLYVFLSLVFMLFFAFGCQTGEDAAEKEEPEEVMDLALVRQSIEEANVKFGEAVRSSDGQRVSRWD